MVFTTLQPKIAQRESSGIFLSSTFKLPRLVGVPLYASVVARVSLVVADEIVGETQPRTVSVAAFGRRTDQRNPLATSSISVVFAGPKLGHAVFGHF